MLRGLPKGALAPAQRLAFPARRHRRDLPGEDTMRRYPDDDEVDLCIVGAGAGGSVLAQRLARHGWRVVILEAGPFWHPDEDWVSDEAGLAPAVLDPEADHRRRRPGRARQEQQRPRRRRLDGPLRGLHAPLPPSDFETLSRDGVGADWPISYRDLSRPLRAGGAGAARRRPDLALGRPAQLSVLAAPGQRRRLELWRGAQTCGIPMRAGPVGIVNGTFGNRPHCIYRGYCLQGCKVNAKASPYVTHLPDALAHGVEMRADSMAVRVEVDATGRATRRELLPGERWRRTAAARRVVAVGGYSIETPRLLLNSASRRFPHGLCNNEDQVGRYVMVQGATQTAGRYPEEVRMYKAPPPEVSRSTSTRRTRRAASRAGSASRPWRRCPSAGRSTCSPRVTGVARCVSTCATTTTGPPSACSTNCSPSRTTG